VRKRVLQILLAMFALWICAIGGTIIALGNDDDSSHEFCEFCEIYEEYYRR